MQRGISEFNPKAPPPKTPAFWATVDSNRSPEESELADLLDALGSPDVVTLSRMQVTAKDGFADWLRDRKNRRVIPHRLEKCGYVPVRNPGSDDGLWKISGRRQAVYAQAKLSLRDQIAAIRYQAMRWSVKSVIFYLLYTRLKKFSGYRPCSCALCEEIHTSYTCVNILLFAHRDNGKSVTSLTDTPLTGDQRASEVRRYQTNGVKFERISDTRITIGNLRRVVRVVRLRLRTLRSLVVY